MAKRTRRSGNALAAGNTPSSKAAEAQQKAEKAYRLWLRGYSFAGIATELGYANRGAAYKAWERARKLLSMPADLIAERDRERERLEIAYAGIAERVEQGNDWAIDRAMSIAQRKAALLGLDNRDGVGSGVARAKRITLVDADDVAAPPLAGPGKLDAPIVSEEIQ